MLCLTIAACPGGSRAPAAFDGSTPIAEIQGSGPASLLAGRTVTVSGIVTGDFQERDADSSNSLGGFFLQSEQPDGDPDTSDGIFVFDGPDPAVDVEVGQRVVVAGTVTEHFGETQVVASAVTIAGSGAIEPTSVSLPVPTVTNSDGETIADLERYEGMLVSVAGPLTITDLSDLERYGALTLAAGGRVEQFTNRTRPNVSGYAAYENEVAARTIVLDDGLAVQNAPHVRHLRPNRADPAGYRVRGGDRVTALTGNLRYSRGSGPNGFETWRLMPAEPPVFEVRNPPQDRPQTVGGSVRVASFNLLNFFPTVDDGTPRCGPGGTEGCRGADSEAEFARQRAKTVNTILHMDVDVVGLMEIENDGGAALADIVRGLNDSGDGGWAYVDTGVIGTDAITVAIIHRDTVVPSGDFALLTNAVDVRFDDDRNRPALAQSFRHRETGGTFTVAVNHLKSKGSPCDDVGDPNRRDGQGNCNLTRRNAAKAEADWLQTDPTASGDPDVLVIGDLNAYLEEDPVIAFEEAGFINLLKRHVGPAAYSFSFDGRVGALDHALASPSLAARVRGATEWHINADEAPLLDYNLEFGRDPGLFDASDPARTSDHDPVIVGFDP